MNYDLNSLGNERFEELVQSLSIKMFGANVAIFGKGPDGGREASFYIKANGSLMESTDEYCIVQAKFKDLNTKKPDFQWVKKQFEDEMNKLIQLSKKGIKLPQHYHFFTNIIFTAVKDTGIFDKMIELKKDYSTYIKNIYFHDYNKINRLLDGYEDIRKTYYDFIVPGDIISEIANQIVFSANEIDSLLRYMNNDINNDKYSKLEQAGMSNDADNSIDKVFVDLRAKSINSKEEVLITNYIFSKSFDISRDIRQKSFVLRGLAGQGKSTITQYIAQIFRMDYLCQYGNYSKPYYESVIAKFSKDFAINISLKRIPFRIELRRYSQWIDDQKKENKNSGMVSYLCHDIEKATGDCINTMKLRSLFEKGGWCFIFDGLDEVALSSNKTEVVENINKFIEIDLLSRKCDSIVILTTRPEGYNKGFDFDKFTHFDLIELSMDECKNYLSKLMMSIENSPKAREEYLTILYKVIENPNISKLMKTPLYATIMALLVKNGGEPPRDKFGLFRDYFNIIIKRERFKLHNSVLNNSQDVIVEIYHKLGYHLQLQSETKHSSGATLSRDELNKLITEYLIDERGEKESITQDLIEEIRRLIVDRINLVTEIEDNKIGFGIRSTQEFMAANYIITKFIDDDLKDKLKSISLVPYWRNTFTFIVENYANNMKSHIDFIECICGELNGSDADTSSEDFPKLVNYGSRVAFNILLEKPFNMNKRLENKFIKYLSNILDNYYIEDVEKINLLSDHAKNELVSMIARRLEKKTLTKIELTIFLVLFSTGFNSFDFQLIEKIIFSDYEYSKQILGVMNKVTFAYDERVSSIDYQKVLKKINHNTIDIDTFKRPLLSAYIAEFKNTTYDNRKLFITCFKIENTFAHDELESSCIDDIFDFQILPLYPTLSSGSNVSFFNGLSFSYFDNFDKENFNKMIQFLNENKLKTLKALYEILYFPKVESFEELFVNYDMEEIDSLGITQYLNSNTYVSFLRNKYVIEKISANEIIKHINSTKDNLPSNETQFISFLSNPYKNFTYGIIYGKDTVKNIFQYLNNMNIQFDCNVNNEIVELVSFPLWCNLDEVKYEYSSDKFINEIVTKYIKVQLEKNSQQQIPFNSFFMDIYISYLLNTQNNVIISDNYNFMVQENVLIRRKNLFHNNRFKKLIIKLDSLYLKTNNKLYIEIINKIFIIKNMTIDNLIDNKISFLAKKYSKFDVMYVSDIIVQKELLSIVKLKELSIYEEFIEFLVNNASSNHIIDIIKTCYILLKLEGKKDIDNISKLEASLVKIVEKTIDLPRHYYGINE